MMLILQNRNLIRALMFPDLTVSLGLFSFQKLSSRLWQLSDKHNRKKENISQLRCSTATSQQQTVSSKVLHSNMKRSKWLTNTHQADKDEDELDDVCVGHRVEPPQQCVDYGHHWGDDDGVDVGQIQDHTHSSTWKNTEWWAPEDWHRQQLL